jgi:hypothetical protein
MAARADPTHMVHSVFGAGGELGRSRPLEG